MEAAQLIDRAFWAADSPAAPGVAEIDGLLECEGLEGRILFRTSGSTGEPKWIAHGREGLLLSAAEVNRHLGVDASSCWALALPLRHVGGFGVVARAFESGCRLAVMTGPWDPSEFARQVRDKGVTHGSLVPTQVHDLVVAGARAPAGLEAVVVGGGLLAEKIGNAARELGWPVLASYGLTEAASQVATQGKEVLDQPYQCQPIPVLPHWEVRIAGDGRIELRGSALFHGMVVKSGSGWSFEARRGDGFVTSDRGVLAAGGLRVSGRADALVKVLGELVDPLEVEGEIGQQGLVVVAVADERRGSRLVAVIDGPADARAAEQRLASYNAGVPGFLRVDGPRRVAEIPRGGLGKVLRIELVRRLSEGEI